MKFVITALILATLPSASALASTPVDQVDKIDTAREGNLSALAIGHFKASLAISCEESFQLPKFDIVKVASESANEKKEVGTPYNYSATYLVVQKCLSGSTFVGAYSDPVKSVLLKGSFHSKYNRKGGPLKMEDLQFELVREVDLSLTH